MLSELARSNPNGIALVVGEQHRTWAELYDRVTRWARFMREDLGLAPHDHAGLLMTNRCEAFEGILAGIEAGIWMTPINCSQLASSRNRSPTNWKLF